MAQLHKPIDRLFLRWLGQRTQARFNQIQSIMDDAQELSLNFALLGTILDRLTPFVAHHELGLLLGRPV